MGAYRPSEDEDGLAVLLVARDRAIDGGADVLPHRVHVAGGRHVDLHAVGALKREAHGRVVSEGVGLAQCRG